MLRWTHALVLALHLALISALLLTAQSSLGLIAALLLFLPLHGLLRGRPRTAAWATMLLVFYCAFLLAEGWADPARKVEAFALAALAAADFIALIVFVRVSSRIMASRTNRASAARTAG